MVLDTFEKNNDLLIFKNTFNDPDNGQPKQFKIQRTDPNAPEEFYFVHIQTKDTESLVDCVHSDLEHILMSFDVQNSELGDMLRRSVRILIEKLYEAMKQEPRRATLRTSNLLDVCTKLGSHDLVYRPVITLTRTENGKTSGHAVVVKSYDRSEEYLDLTTIDSLSETGETSVECEILDNGEKQFLDLTQFPDQWCLADEKCYYFQLN